MSLWNNSDQLLNPVSEFNADPQPSGAPMKPLNILAGDDFIGSMEKLFQ